MCVCSVWRRDGSEISLLPTTTLSEAMEPDSFQKCTVGAWDGEKGNSDVVLEHFHYKGSQTAAQEPRKVLKSPSSERLKAWLRIWPWAACYNQTCSEQQVGSDGLQRSLPAHSIQPFCEKHWTGVSLSSLLAGFCRLGWVKDNNIHVILLFGTSI